MVRKAISLSLMSALAVGSTFDIAAAAQYQAALPQPAPVPTQPAMIPGQPVTYPAQPIPGQPAAQQPQVDPSLQSPAAVDPQDLDPLAALEDVTNKIVMRPGLTLVFPISKAIDTHWQPVGSYNFVASIQNASPTGFSYRWAIPHRTRITGDRHVLADDVHHSYKVSLFYPHHNDCSLVGYMNIVRISDDLYRDLRTGQPTPFELDGPDIPHGHTRNPDAVASEITGVGIEYVPVLVNGQKCKVRAIKAVTNNRWAYWIMDNPKFPIMLQGAGPFYWTEPQLTDARIRLGPDDSGDGATKEARRIVKDLKDKGVATSYLILFEFDSAKLRPASKAILREVSRYLNESPDVRLKVEGHTCTIGSLQYNMGLSGRRANSVSTYLIEDCGIGGDRLQSKGFGYLVPAASNGTAAGRARNRRVIFRKF